MERLIIDTDPGVDDAQAILMAAAHPHTKIEAILSVSGNVGLADTTRNALTIVEAVEQEIPVYPGCASPLVAPAQNAAFVHGQDGLGDVGLRPRNRRAEAEHAAVALVRMVRAEPGSFTLIAIGPLTNIAVALKLDPGLPSLLKRFVVMGGAVTARGNAPNVSTEFNIFADPEGAQVVFAAWEMAGRQIELVDWEATTRHGIPAAMLARWHALDNPRARFFQAVSAITIKRFVKKYPAGGELFAADPLAMAVALEPDAVLQAEAHHLSVETAGQHTRGQTTVDWGDRLGRPANALIVQTVDQTRFLALMEAALA